MRLTTNGYKVPESGDRGGGANGFFQALEYDIERVSSHNHDGNNSEFITTKAIRRQSATIASNAWTEVAPSTYKQTIDLPAGMTMQNSALQFQIPVNGSNYGSIIYPSVEVVSETRFNVYVNDPTLNLTVYY
jgi:hypothetical protein